MKWRRRDWHSRFAWLVPMIAIAYCFTESFRLKAEEARTRGTPVTLESFRAWKVKFDNATAIKRARDEDEKLKGMSPKEREEFKKIVFRLTGPRVSLIFNVWLIHFCCRQTTVRAR